LDDPRDAGMEEAWAAEIERGARRPPADADG